MSHHGFVRVATAAPHVAVANCEANAENVLGLMARAESEGVAVLLFPELSLTGYTCADLFHQKTLQRGALAALRRVMERGKAVYSGVAVVGLPLVVDDQLFNCAAVLHQGKILGIIPKSFIPNYKEFYEHRWFAPAATVRSQIIPLFGQDVHFGTNLLFDAADVDYLTIAVEICEDLWVPIPPSCFLAIQGATILLNLSASNERIGVWQYRRDLVLNQSGRCIAAYLYAGSGVTESTTDVVFGGHCMIAENAIMLAESKRFEQEEVLLIADVDLDRLRIDRVRANPFDDAKLYYDTREKLRRVSFALNESKEKAQRGPNGKLRRYVDPHPFVPSERGNLEERCEEIFHTQICGLAKRLEHIGKPRVAIGISGGLDSTLALLVTCKTFDRLKEDHKKIQAITMPGFGTSEQTYENAVALMRELGVSPSEVDIRQLCLDEMKALRHKPFGIDIEELTLEEFERELQNVPAEDREDLVFENVQARMRTSILMNTAFVIGTGDVSELALGWCTYNADHMSMYNPNCSIPKTLVRFLVRWVANNEFSGKARKILLDIVATPISPELLPTQAGEIAQETEKTIGPYELHDFFLYQFLRFGTPPEKILYLAEHAQFERGYSRDEIRQWLRVFIRRFFANQFKRSCLPDGPKVGSISLSPRGDWRMPSDAQAALWLKWVEEGE